LAADCVLKGDAVKRQSVAVVLNCVAAGDPSCCRAQNADKIPVLAPFCPSLSDEKSLVRNGRCPGFAELAVNFVLF
jgi:hypothetical protein